MDDDLFNNLLTAVEETASKPDRRLRDDPTFLSQSSTAENESLVHTGLTDSSDDEDNRDFQEAKYNSCGKAVKYHLQVADASQSPSSNSIPTVSSKWNQKSDHPVPNEKQLQIPVKQQPVHDVYTDPIFGIRIINPLVSSATLKDRMQGRLAISLMKLRTFVENVPVNTDWVVSGVIVYKTGRTSQKGNPFAIWTLTDLHGDFKTFSLFLFRSAYKDLWKCSIGTVVGVLNPSVFEKRQGSKDEACLSVDNVQKVMIIGQSKDCGTCRSVKKDGTPCTSFVNLNRCEYCVYHVKQEYQKCSKRSELQSGFSGRGLNALRNKVLGKNEVFYAGKSFTAIPAAKSRKLQARDEGRLSLLAGLSTKSNNTHKVKEVMSSAVNAKRKTAAVQHVEVSASRRLKDLELLKKLGASSTKADDASSASPSLQFGATISASSEVTLKESKAAVLNVIAKLKAKKVTETVHAPENSSIPLTSNTTGEGDMSDIDFSLSDKQVERKHMKASIVKVSPDTPKSAQSAKTIGTIFDNPVLSGIGNKMIDLSSPITQKHIHRANLNAVKWVQRNGPIQKENPNKTTPKGGRKRVLDVLEKQDPKRRKIQESDHFSQRFKQMMAATSKHADLLEERDNEEAEKYFDKLEAKEKMEEKMISTYKVQCKAVRCLQCKYTGFSAADRCKEERHPLKVFDAIKRFFKCGDCGNRTVSLSVIPTLSCKKCGGSKWERTGMMKEKVVMPKSELSIRGGEQEHVNSHVTNANINLLVPEDE